MDNQQATLGWLAGIIDGEGSIGIYRKTRGKSSIFSACVRISNTSPEMIQRIVEIFDDLSIGTHVGEHRGVKSTKPYWQVSVWRMTEIKKLIELLLPYLVAKLAHARLVLRFVNRRLELGPRGGYDEEQLDCVVGLGELNNYEGKSSETMSEARRILKELTA